MKYRKLGKTDIEVSILAYGASPLGNVFGETDETEGFRAIQFAIESGINYFDVAPMYGVTLAEERLGRGLKGKRQNLFLATKCCRYDTNVFDFSAKRVKESINQSLKRLQTDYVDVYQVHDVEFGEKRQILEETIPAALEVKKSGKARYIGITGLPVRYLRHISEQVEVDTILSWGHYNLVEDEMDTFLTNFCRDKQIGLINASPLHQRLLTTKGPPDWHRSPKEVLNIQPELVSICKKYDVNISDVAMKFCMDYPYVSTTVVGMSKRRHVEENLKAIDFEIPKDLFGKLSKIVKPIKNRMWFEGRPENNL